MKINRDSWHYRFIEYWLDEPSDNLCNYFWQVVFCFIRSFLILSVIFTFCFAAACVLVGLYGLFSPQFITPNSDSLITVMYAAGILIMVVGVFVGSIIGLFILARMAFNREREYKNKPSIFIEYIKAKKQKICPLIEFE